MLMKKIALFLSLFFLLIFSSCTKNQASGTDIVGKWVPTEIDYISFYWEFTSANVLNYYVLVEPNGIDYDDYQYCTFNNGTLYVPQGYTWKLAMSSDYQLDGNRIIFSGMDVGVVSKVDKDKLVFKSSAIVDGVVERVKKFATK